MHPSFFKELGPIGIDKIKSSIQCETSNLIDNEYFKDFVSLNRVTEKSLSFIYNNKIEIDDLPLNSCLICTESKVKDLHPKQKVIIVVIINIVIIQQQIKLIHVYVVVHLNIKQHFLIQ